MTSIYHPLLTCRTHFYWSASRKVLSVGWFVSGSVLIPYVNDSTYVCSIRVFAVPNKFIAVLKSVSVQNVCTAQMMWWEWKHGYLHSWNHPACIVINNAKNSHTPFASFCQQNLFQNSFWEFRLDSDPAAELNDLSHNPLPYSPPHFHLLYLNMENAQPFVPSRGLCVFQLQSTS